MQEVYETNVKIVPSLSDAAGQLSIPDTFGLFMDIASTHAELLGSGYDAMRENGQFWLTVKTMIHFEELPRMGETVTLRTWPEEPGKVRCNRSYELIRDSRRLVCGKTEWAIWNYRENKLVPAAGIYPEDLSFPYGTACKEDFSLIPDTFVGVEPYADYTVRSTDIDVGRHMNNVAYIRALAGSFSGEGWKQLPIRKMEVHFRTPCYEGDRIIFQKKQTPNRLDLRLSKGETTLTLARMEL